MDRTKRFVFNTVWTAITQVTAIICGFFINRIILVTYSVETSGFTMSVIQYSSYFVLAVGGIAGAASYALYAPLADRDFNKANAILTKAWFVFVKITVRKYVRVLQ